MFASKDVIDEHAKYMNFIHKIEKRQSEAKDSLEFVRSNLDHLASIASAMRKELGHRDRAISSHDIAMMFITDYDGSAFK